MRMPRKVIKACALLTLNGSCVNELGESIVHRCVGVLLSAAKHCTEFSFFLIRIY